ncbi:MAG: hypothetical protein JNL50_00945 [Phycisphaerae bacterium]|nr:hypothetical protein [Phycisphaerae bacterium]
MKPTRLSPRSVDLIGLCACAAVLGAFYVLAAAPLLAERSDTRQAAESVKAENDRINRLTASVRLTRQSIAAASERLARTGGGLARAESVNARISTLVDLARALKLELGETTPGALRSGKEFDAIPVTLGGRGPLSGLASFLDTLHAELTDVAVDAIEVRTGQAGSRDPGAGVEFSLSLTCFVEHAAGDNHANHADQADPADPRGSDAGAGAPATNSPGAP